MHRASMVMKALGLCEWRLLFQASFYSLVLNTLLWRLLLNVSSQTRFQQLVQPPHPTYTLTMRSLHILHVEDMRVNWMPFHLLGEQFDCIFNAEGCKYDRMSSREL